MDIATLKDCLAEIEGAHGTNGEGYDIQVMLIGGHCLRGPWGWAEAPRGFVPRFIFIVQGIGAGTETFTVPIASIVALGGCS